LATIENFKCQYQEYISENVDFWKYGKYWLNFGFQVLLLSPPLDVGIGR
jgi:hypothetical protein